MKRLVRTTACRAPMRIVALLLIGSFAAGVTLTATAADEPWQVAGQQGLVRFVIVPVAHAADQVAYEKQLVSLCDPERTCFINFYTNSTSATAGVPLPDAIANEATATYRRSMKNGVQRLLWSCRLKLPVDECF
ncbi:MAG: hypothetical protein ABIV63_04815 [Caldimonas sp.]